MMELQYYLWLESIKGCGCVTAARLIKRFGSAQAVYENDQIGALLEIEELSYETAFSLITQKNLDIYKRQIDLLHKMDCEYLTYSDPAYPAILKEIHDPPMILYYKGSNIFTDCALSISIVGARKATPYGLSVAKTVSAQLAKAGMNIISGLAAGIDSASHKGALSVNGCTVGVLGCGIDLVYPPSNRKLYESIISNNGMILTEFPPGTEPTPTNFPRRNRIISGLSYGTLVVEASEKSGSLITAKYAAEQGREVYAVPGRINDKQSSGCNYLIKDGAKLVSRGNDILEDMFHVFRPMVESEQKELPEMTSDEKELYAAVTKGIRTAGELAKTLQRPIQNINSTITMLELKEIITVDMGNIYIVY